MIQRDGTLPPVKVATMLTDISIQAQISHNQIMGRALVGKSSILRAEFLPSQNKLILD
jgi:hypothetical protein